MIKDFETIKGQLSAPATVINLFKSEAVQLRILESLLDEPWSSGAKDSSGKRAGRRARGKQSKKNVSAATEGVKTARKKKPASGTGAVATLAQLAATTFFDKPRTINDIIDHCKVKLARKFKPNEFSSKLGRMVRNDELTREKNDENQYEYKKP